MRSFLILPKRGHSGLETLPRFKAFLEYNYILDVFTLSHLDMLSFRLFMLLGIKLNLALCGNTSRSEVIPLLSTHYLCVIESYSMTHK